MKIEFMHAIVVRFSLTFSYYPYEYFVVLYVESVNVIMIHFDKKNVFSNNYGLEKK